MLSRAPEGEDRPRLLLVEDDAPVRRSLQLLLQSRGYEVRAYRSAAGLASDPEALRAECLVSDLVLPGDDGLVLLHELRAVGWKGCAVLISGQIDERVRANAEAEGYAMVLAKPVTDALLTGSIARLISSERARPPATPLGAKD